MHVCVYVYVIDPPSSHEEHILHAATEEYLQQHVRVDNDTVRTVLVLFLLIVLFFSKN